MLDENKSIGSANTESEENVNLSELLFKYLAYWPWFVASVLICLISCFVFLRFQTPVYQISAAVLIKEDDKKSAAAGTPFGAIQDLGMFSMTSNFENEVEILRSRTLIKKVVVDLGLYINVSEEHLFGYDRPLYQNSPIQVYMTPEEAEHLKGGAELELKYQKGGNLLVKAKYLQDEELEEVEASFDHLPAVLPTPVGVFSFLPNEEVLKKDSLKNDSKINMN